MKVTEKSDVFVIKRYYIMQISSTSLMSLQSANKHQMLSQEPKVVIAHSFSLTWEFVVVINEVSI